MSDLVSIIVAWAIVIGGLGAYGLSVVARGKALAKQVPKSRQRWMTTDTAEQDGGSA